MRRVEFKPTHLMGVTLPMGHSVTMTGMTKRLTLAELPEDGRCTASSKQSGERCKQLAIVGGAVCVYHGGKIPQVIAAAADRMDEARNYMLERVVERVQAPDEDLDLGTLVKGIVELTKVARLERGDVTERKESRHLEFSESRLRIDATLDGLREAHDARVEVIEAAGAALEAST